MQSFGGSIRLVRRHATNCPKDFDFSLAKGRMISGGSLLGKLNSSSARNEVGDAKFVGSSILCSNGLDYASRLRKLASYSKLQLTQPSMKKDLLSSSSNGRHPASLLYRAHKPDPCHQSVAMQTLSVRCISTMDNSSNSTEQDASPSVSGAASRIKFKRLDKTARHIMQILDTEAVGEVKQQREIPDIKPGHIIQLKVEVPENKRRVSILKGIVIARRNAGLNTTFRLRRLVAGVGVESLFPLYSPNIKEIKILDKKKVRRAKLYYLRDRMNPLKK